MDTTGLRQLIKGWCQEKEGRNLSSLSRVLNMNYQTLWRIDQGRTVPTPDNVIKICSKIATKEQSVLIMKEMAPLISGFANEISEPNLRPTDNIVSHMTDPNNFLVICLASKDAGTTKDEVQKCLGHLGVFSLQNLVEVEAIKQENENFFLIKNDLIIKIFDSNLTKMNMQSLLHQYVPSRNKRETLHFAFEGVSKDCYGEIQEILAEAKEKIERKIKEKKNRGKTNFFYGMFSNVMGSDENE